MKVMTSALMKKGMNKVGGVDTVVNVGFGAVSGISTYNEAKAEGKSTFMAGAEAALLTAFWSTVGLKTGLVIGAGTLAYEGGKVVVNKGLENNRMFQQYGAASPFANSTFVDSQQAYTMRQAGVTQIQNNAMNMKKTIMGNEAMHMHR